MAFTPAREIFAHSVKNKPTDEWELLQVHAVRVGHLSAHHAAPFGFGPAANLAGLLHDIGKCSSAFQDYIRSSDGAAHGPNHAYAGALVALERLPKPLGRILARIIAGHHAGLADGADLDERLVH
jgi:CRISPR-associated endonuclease/helicase Cas3